MLHRKCVGRLEKSMTQLLPHNGLIAFAPPPLTARKQRSLLQEDLTELRANQPVLTLKVKKKILCDFLVNLFSLCVLQYGRYMTNLSKKFREY